jgi:hypothetical protein
MVMQVSTLPLDDPKPQVEAFASAVPVVRAKMGSDDAAARATASVP